MSQVPVHRDLNALRVAWVHSFDSKVLNSGVFMRGVMRQVELEGVDLNLLETGKLSGPRSFLNAFTRLKSQVCEYDIVHAQYGSGCGLLTSMLPGKKVLTLRGSDWYGWQSVSGDSSRHRRRLGAVLSRNSLRRFDHIIVVSKRMRDEVSRWVDLDNISVLPSGIDLAHFRPIEKMRARAMLGEKGDSSKWILFASIAADNPIKRISLAESAYAECKQLIPNAKFKILSGIPHEQVPLYMSSCDVLLLTSRYEGWPNVVKEALACDVPFVSTDVSDLHEIAAQNGSCRVVAANPQALGRALADTLSVREKCDLRRHVVDMSSDRFSRRLLKIYKKVRDT